MLCQQLVNKMFSHCLFPVCWQVVNGLLTTRYEVVEAIHFGASNFKNFLEEYSPDSLFVRGLRSWLFPLIYYLLSHPTGKSLKKALCCGLCLNYVFRYLFQAVQKQTTAAYCRILPTLDHHVWDLFLVVQKQTTTAYCRILPTMDLHVWDIFSGSSDTNHDSLL
jgi:hypothetical protein